MTPYKVSVPPAPKPYPGGILRCEGNRIVNEHGETVILKGAGLGGHLNMENFITGYPGHEEGMRRALKKVLGEEKYNHFFDRFLEYFFTEKDAAFFASLGLNAIRIPVNYRHFESDDEPGVWKEKGFAWLDRVINLCGAAGVFAVIDLHAAPGGQNIDWHADSGVAMAMFWEYADFQKRAIKLWEEFARRYKDNTWVAGYNLLNEPTDPEGFRLQRWYDQAEKAVRAVDSKHILFLDGNTFAADFSCFDRPYPNTVYAYHDYSKYGFDGSGGYQGTEEQKGKLRRSWERKVEFMKETGTPQWNGEFGPVYASPDDDDWEKTNAERYNLLKDQLNIYQEAGSSWSIWLYKDLGFQGMVHASDESSYKKALKPFLDKKKRLAVDEWGTNTSQVQHLYDPIEQMLEKEAPHIHERYPKTWSTSTHVGRHLRNILLSEELYPEYAAYFKDLSLDELDAFAMSFHFDNCKQREGLNEVLRSYA